MAIRLGGSRVAGDPAFIGSVVGFFVSVVLFAIMMGLSLRNDRSSDRMGCSCLLRLGALLVLTLGLGAGYMIGRSLTG
jgi:hypothetical protein